MEHPWIKQLMDHKYVLICCCPKRTLHVLTRVGRRWNSFAKQTFRSEFHLYTIYFVAVFIAT